MYQIKFHETKHLTNDAFTQQDVWVIETNNRMFPIVRNSNTKDYNYIGQPLYTWWHYEEWLNTNNDYDIDTIVKSITEYNSLQEDDYWEHM